GLLDEQHEIRRIPRGHVAAENLQSDPRVDVRPVAALRKIERYVGWLTKKGYDALGARRQLEGGVWVGVQQLDERIHWPHDREERTPQLLLHCSFGYTLDGHVRTGARREHHIPARYHRLHISETSCLEGAAQVGHAGIHGADATKECCVPCHGSECVCLPEQATGRDRPGLPTRASRGRLAPKSPGHRPGHLQ